MPKYIVLRLEGDWDEKVRLLNELMSQNCEPS